MLTDSQAEFGDQNISLSKGVGELQGHHEHYNKVPVGLVLLPL